MYTNEKLDITIIEIKEYEDDLKNDYLELEDNIINYLKLDKIELNKTESPDYLDESIYDIYLSLFFSLHNSNEIIKSKSCSGFRSFV